MVITGLRINIEFGLSIFGESLIQLYLSLNLGARDTGLLLQTRKNGLGTEFPSFQVSGEGMTWAVDQ